METHIGKDVVDNFNSHIEGLVSNEANSDIEYFDCKICCSTFTMRKNQENEDPNAVSSGTCKNCRVSQKFQLSLPQDINEVVNQKSQPNTNSTFRLELSSSGAEDIYLNISINNS